MSSFIITGGKKLSGDIIPQGAKNEALQVICATVLTSDKVTIENIPDIRDVNKLIEILRLIGVKVERTGSGTYSFQADNIDLAQLESDVFCETASKLRGSIMLAGPLLSRFGKAVFPQPGGDKIGRRRLDTHFIGLENLGANISYNYKYYTIEAKQLNGCYMLLDEASVTGTANIVMTAVLAHGTTTIMNATRCSDPVSRPKSYRFMDFTFIISNAKVIQNSFFPKRICCFLKNIHYLCYGNYVVMITEL